MQIERNSTHHPGSLPISLFTAAWSQFETVPYFSQRPHHKSGEDVIDGNEALFLAHDTEEQWDRGAHEPLYGGCVIELPRVVGALYLHGEVVVQRARADRRAQSMCSTDRDRSRFRRLAGVTVPHVEKR